MQLFHNDYLAPGKVFHQVGAPWNTLQDQKEKLPFPVIDFDEFFPNKQNEHCFAVLGRPIPVSPPCQFGPALEVHKTPIKTAFPIAQCSKADPDVRRLTFGLEGRSAFMLKSDARFGLWSKPEKVAKKAGSNEKRSRKKRDFANSNSSQRVGASTLKGEIPHPEKGAFSKRLFFRNEDSSF